MPAAADGRQPAAQPGVPPRPQSWCERRIERHPAVPRRRRQLAASSKPTDYDILQEVLVRAHAAGWRVLEIPLHYRAERQRRFESARRARAAYLRTFWKLWKLRNSIAAADYDYRAHDSPIPLQRYWQRSRYRYITELIDGPGPGARRRLRIEPHHRRAAEGQRGARRAAQQAAVRAPIRRAARPRLRLRAAVCRRAASRACCARRSSSTCRWSRR